ncbi:hypothetical protein FCN77_20050 [Arthrobacter sp. 24S4-2]|uniref:TetR/AcrR family transcriptional regulator C-terminal domain-containing protein n=1 Tax=Arthrobacter sp. 24S4-2 TaxID=2575374 RepID=UPI0010C7D7FF|nr:hypothetical protein FCN77_20050 [Arthrobacter sp. 24S4-2]
MLRDHPWAITPLIGHPYPGPNALPIGEAALRILRRAGITGDPAVAAFSGIVALNYGWATFVLRSDEPLRERRALRAGADLVVGRTRGREPALTGGGPES